MRYPIMLALFSALLWQSFAIAEDKKEVNVAAQDTIYLPKDGLKEFAVKGENAKFRITIMTIAGGSIDNKPIITGNAKQLHVAEIVHVDEDGQPQLGALVKEFVFQGTGLGKVTIEFKKTIPTSPMPAVEIYKVKIK